jgi:hypothetical protein
MKGNSTVERVMQAENPSFPFIPPINRSKSMTKPSDGLTNETLLIMEESSIFPNPLQRTLRHYKEKYPDVLS